MDIKDLITPDEQFRVIDDGAWVGDFVEAPGLELKVVGLRSKNARKAMKQKQADLRKKNRGKPLSDEQLSQCTKEVLHEIVLKDWKGLTDGDKAIPYDRKMAKTWIESRNGEDFMNLVLEACQHLDRNAGAFVGEVTKNS